MKPERRMSSFLGDTLEYRESEQIADDKLIPMVEALRSGQRDMINPIIMGHLRLVMKLVANSRRSKRQAQDIEGAAFLALVECVNNCCPHTDEWGVYHPGRLDDNNITYYITSTVKWAIKDEYGADHILRMPARTVRFKIAQGEKFEDVVPGAGIGIRESDPDLTESDEGIRTTGDYIMPFYIPIAKAEFPDLSFTEALDKSIQSEMERAIVRFRSEDCTYAEVGKKVGLTPQWVCKMMEPIEKRFDYNYK